MAEKNPIEIAADIIKEDEAKKKGSSGADVLVEAADAAQEDKIEASKDAEGFEKSAKYAAKRTEYQCFLTNYMEQLIDGSIAVRNNNEKSKSKSGLTRLKKVSRVLLDPADILSLVAPKKIGAFFELTPAQIAVLQPRIRIYKVEKNEGEGGGKKRSEFIFRDSVYSGDISQLTNAGLGRIPDVGITSFSIEMTGGSEQKGVDFSIMATLVLKCTNIEALVINSKNDDGTYPHGKTVSLNNNTPPPFIDIAIPSGKLEANPSPSSRDFEIHAEIGWEIPNIADDMLFANFPGGIADVNTILNRSRLILTLLPRRTNIKFSQDGSIDFQIDFRAWLDKYLNDPNLDIFNIDVPTTSATQQGKIASDPGTREAAIRKIVAEVLSPKIKDDIASKTFKALNTKIVNMISSIKASDSAEFEKQFLEKIKQMKIDNKDATNVVEVIDNITSLISSSDIEKSAVALQKAGELINKQAVIFHILKNKLLVTEYDQEKHNKFQAAKEYASDSWWRKAALEIGEISEEKQVLTVKATSGEEIDKLVGDITTLAVEKIKTEKESLERSKGLNDELTYNVDTITTKGKDGIVRIKYFLYGDLLEGILEGFENQYGPDMFDGIRFLLGSFKPSHIPGRKFSLADVPVSLDYFIEWWTRKVIIKGRESFKLRDFLNDSIDQLLQVIITPTCLENDPNKKNSLINHFSFVAPKKDFDSEIKHKDQILKLARNYDNRSFESLINYYYIYLSDVNVIRFGDKEQDEADGVYHLKLGQSAGFVKEIEFTRIDDRYRKEALTSKETPFSILMERYNANVRMVGNGIFQPGMVVYIKPFSAESSGGLSEQILRKIGLGGYYWVTGTEINYDGSSYETSISCTWNSPPASSSDIIDSVNNIVGGGIVVGQIKTAMEQKDPSRKE